MPTIYQTPPISIATYLVKIVEKKSRKLIIIANLLLIFCLKNYKTKKKSMKATSNNFGAGKLLKNEFHSTFAIVHS